VTAREARAVASVFGELESPTVAGERGGALRQLVARGFERAGADEPVLGRLVQRMNMTRSAQPAAARWTTPASIFERLGGLAIEERRAIVRAMEMSGWSQPELEVLRIESPAAEAAQPSARKDVKAGTTAAVRASKMGRSLARIVTGTEGLGGPVGDKGVGPSAAQLQSATWLPLASGRGSKYFGGLAPGAKAPGAGSGALESAVGDLVKMAEAAVAMSDTPIALSARKELLRRAEALRAQGVESSALRTAIGALSSRTTGLKLAELAEQIDGRVGTTLAAAMDRAEKAMVAEPRQRTMHIGEVERMPLELEAESSGLEARLAKALALSASGPAGARRMLRGTAGAAAQPEATRRAGRDFDDAAHQHETVMSGASPDARAGKLGAQAQHEAALREEMQRALSVALGGVMAPEAMLAGLRSRELSQAIRTLVSRQAKFGLDLVPVLTTLADSGVDLEAARSSIAAYMHGDKVMKRFAGGDAAAYEPGGLASRGVRQVESALAGNAPERWLVELMAEAEGILTGSGTGGMSRRQRVGLLSSILRGTERAEMTAILEQAGGREFAMAWLNRVDGTRSGIDIGMMETRKDFGRAFGDRRLSAVAGVSPIGGASFVDTSVPGHDEDRSGLRSVAASMVHTSTGAARPQHGASQAIRRTDWSFVDTGSRTSTPHADLGKLASAIIGSAESAQRAPMPLVAPAAKAIAQTALRAPKSESVGRSGGSSGQGGKKQAGGQGGPTDAKMSEEAIEMLAIEMANRVARLMGLKNERRGIWS
jgi:hypothetical protein